jgi:predicted transposase YbfD/YdcC
MNILGNINADSLDKIFMKWCRSLVENRLKDKTISLDGKTVRSTDAMDTFNNPLHIVSAQIAEYGLTIGQVAVMDKSNEIPAVQELIKMLCVEGALVVADALNCQKKTAEAILNSGGDYLLSVKGNQPDLHNDIVLFFETESDNLEKYTASEKGHGRIDTRTAWVTHDVAWYANGGKWPQLVCFGAVRRTCLSKGKTTVETRYYISSRPLSAADLLKYSRNEWSVESMHWLLDVVFNEDRTLVVEKDAQRTLNTLRKTALNLIRIFRDKCSPKSSLVGIMRDNLFAPNHIPAFMHRVASCLVFP